MPHPAVRSALAYFRAGSDRTEAHLHALVEHWAVVLGFMGRESTLNLEELKADAAARARQAFLLVD